MKPKPTGEKKLPLKKKRGLVKKSYQLREKANSTGDNRKSVAFAPDKQESASLGVVASRKPDPQNLEIPTHSEENQPLQVTNNEALALKQLAAESPELFQLGVAKRVDALVAEGLAVMEVPTSVKDLVALVGLSRRIRGMDDKSGMATANLFVAPPRVVKRTVVEVETVEDDPADGVI